MKKKFLPFLFLAVSCTSYTKDVHDIDKDFPTTDTLSFEPIKTFNIDQEVIDFTVMDSAVFIVEMGSENFGHCYNINTGEVISTLVSKGSAQNELIKNPLSGIRIKDGNVYFSNQGGVIKKFSTNEILTKPLGERKVDIISPPNEVATMSYIETGNNELFGTPLPNMNDDFYRYFISVKDSVIYLEKLNEKYKASKNITDKNLSQAPIISCAFENYNNKVVTADYGMMLQIVDLKKRIIENERFYNKIEVDGKGRLKSNEFTVANVKCNEKYIYFRTIRSDFSKTTDKDVYNMYVYVFDWNLNPVKKYFAGAFNYKKTRNNISHDGNNYYYMTVSDEDKQVLYKAEIK